MSIMAPPPASAKKVLNGIKDYVQQGGLAGMAAKKVVEALRDPQTPQILLNTWQENTWPGQVYKHLTK